MSQEAKRSVIISLLGFEICFGSFFLSFYHFPLCPVGLHYAEIVNCERRTAAFPLKASDTSFSTYFSNKSKWIIDIWAF